MSADLIAELGYLCLGSRFRRLGERLQAGVAELASLEGIAIQPAQFPVLAALADGPLTVGTLARRLDLSQPGVTRAVGKLVNDGLVEPAGDTGDQRHRAFRLSNRGRELLEHARRRVFPLVEETVARLCARPDDDLLGHLAHLDKALAEVPFEKRLRARRDRAAGS
ncbi:DNA-binding transcriptional regulator, MarR family [Novosphingobium sp. CF614]|uniref:MarR family winged helix-turn-helix transcriptional regulator n=1 Tax=Novosphingobium sp. CF614 TaxID=1884364 RepID=UPI0008EA9AAD|nr:MarR family transcriptional regulator [Novosphingobium sp. CF614]SFG10037.1 DNA-binding transcriptional regulator, MarR family [Novosphingobium sp. CF614]